MDTYAIVWLVLLILFLGVEAGTVMLVSLWFALGALAALICSLAGGQLWLQAVLFFAVSGLSILALWPIRKKFLLPKITKTNVDALIGAAGKVIQPIDNDNETGRIRLGGMDWAARSSNGQTIDVGAQVVVDKIEGVKAFVTAK